MTIRERVKETLRRFPETRNNDNLLVTYVWCFENPEALTMTAKEFFKDYSKTGKYTPSDTITRARRKIQEEEPALRGSNYQDRQSKQKKVRRDLNELFT